MIGREQAVRLVAALVEQRNQSARSFGAPAVGMVDMVVSQVTEHPLCWVVSLDTAEFVRTGDPGHQLVGGNLYLVDRLDGGLYEINSRAFAVEDWEPGYRQLVRGEPRTSGSPRGLFRRGKPETPTQWIAPANGAR